MIIAKWVSANQRAWDQHLPAVALAYRSSIHEVTGFTPFFLMFGREARMSADLVYGPPTCREDVALSPNEFVDSQMQKLRQA